MKVAKVKRTLTKAKKTSKVVQRSATSTSKRSTKAASTGAPAVLRGIEAVVVNLDNRPDRWAKSQKSLAKAAPWLKVRRLSAVDGRAAPPPVKDVTAKWSTGRLAERFHWYLTKTIKMSPGERGCCASHIAAWRIAAKRSKPLLVIEDDAVGLPTFTNSLATALREAPKGTGAIWLSSKDRGWPKQVGKVLMKPSFVWTTVGYLIWPAAARTFLKMLPMDMPVDNWMAHHIQVGAIEAYSMKPAGVRQAQTWNVGSDVPHSDDVAHR